MRKGSFFRRCRIGARRTWRSWLWPLYCRLFRRNMDRPAPLSFAAFSWALIVGSLGAGWIAGNGALKEYQTLATSAFFIISAWFVWHQTRQADRRSKKERQLLREQIALMKTHERERREIEYWTSLVSSLRIIRAGVRVQLEQKSVELQPTGFVTTMYNASWDFSQSSPFTFDPSKPDEPHPFSKRFLKLPEPTDFLVLPAELLGILPLEMADDVIRLRSIEREGQALIEGIRNSPNFAGDQVRECMREYFHLLHAHRNKLLRVLASIDEILPRIESKLYVVRGHTFLKVKYPEDPQGHGVAHREQT